MLRSRFRALTRNQAAVADHGTVQSPFQNQSMTILSSGGSRRAFDGFLSKFFFQFESKVSSPILYTNLFQPSGNNPFDYARVLSDRTLKFSPLDERKHSWEEESDRKGICLALIDSISDEKPQLVLFGSNLKVQSPSHLLSGFGMNTRNDRSVREMELSEDYTCVISHGHGSSPKTTHIYDNSIVECDCYGVPFGVSKSKKEAGNLTPKKMESSSSSSASSSSDGFLSFCYTCKKDLDHGKDIYIYGGEKSFCSRECRWQEMLFDGLEITGLE